MARDGAPGRPARLPSAELTGDDPAVAADPQAGASVQLWRAVVVQAIVDARSRGKDRPSVRARAEARAWLFTPSPGRSAILDAASLPPDAFDRPQVRARLVADWDRVDLELAHKAADKAADPTRPAKRRTVPVVAPDGRTFASMKAAARLLGIPAGAVRVRALAGRDGWSVAA